MTEKLYAQRDIIAQGEFYTRHVCAMTAEGLWDKSSIAAELAHRDQRIAELEAENENLRTVMIAAAEEIKLHWEAHCDPVEGLGPVNLLRRLECGIPAEYGYKAGNFRRLMYRVKALEAALTPFADAAAHIPEDAEMLDVDYMLDGKLAAQA